MFLLVPAHPGGPRQNPESCKMVVCACVSRVLQTVVVNWYAVKNV